MLLKIEDDLLKLFVYKNQHPKYDQLFQSLSKSNSDSNSNTSNMHMTDININDLVIQRGYGCDLSYLHCYYDDKRKSENNYQEFNQMANKKPKLLMLHGYWTGKLAFVSVIRILAKYFELYIIDAPGNGLSKKIVFNFKNIKESEDYIIQCIENFRENVMFTNKHDSQQSQLQNIPNNTKKNSNKNIKNSKNSKKSKILDTNKIESAHTEQLIAKQLSTDSQLDSDTLPSKQQQIKTTISVSNTTDENQSVIDNNINSIPPPASVGDRIEDRIGEDVDNVDEQFYLLGHSLGGYMCIIYAMKYADRLKGLIVASPAGVAIKPKDLDNRLKSKRTGWAIFSRLFWGRITFQENIRILGFIGKQIFSQWIKSQNYKYGDCLFVDENNNDNENENVNATRINENNINANLNDKCIKQMHKLFTNYNYQINASPKSYERFLYDYLQLYGWARDPLLHRIKSINNVNNKCKVLFLYGENDYMTKDAGYKCCDILNSNQRNMNQDNNNDQDCDDEKTKEKKEKEIEDNTCVAVVKVVGDASHQVFLNQPVKCCQIIFKQILNLDCDV